mmetsp:Transcript_5337/g.10032  ORF Transcript_5337/g.10032 Transcript_5337/m.10032 type:complete len:257 (-) Transcript_5337:365-1135(-)|eukprot:CAMPEP_0178732066 /NCGR_PEP_ID=MMETSP0744-20121128/62_1 /TAXON_ID=913974 /ORGANISM="Nitzschia punctata, Strain CCMP561" /LENGTH=256 /DNA_ID=CAMNT_0020384155 /DNA_START=62 /DNA_END=832 /DNA_ORIENTATION=-
MFRSSTLFLLLAAALVGSSSAQVNGTLSGTGASTSSWEGFAPYETFYYEGGDVCAGQRSASFWYNGTKVSVVADGEGGVCEVDLANGPNGLYVNYICTAEGAVGQAFICPNDHTCSDCDEEPVAFWWQSWDDFYPPMPQVCFYTQQTPFDDMYPDEIGFIESSNWTQFYYHYATPDGSGPLDVIYANTCIKDGPPATAGPPTAGPPTPGPPTPTAGLPTEDGSTEAPTIAAASSSVLPSVAVVMISAVVASGFLPW